MADRSLIEWTDSTFNPWMGCTKVSEGCKHCYAEELIDKRYGKAEWGPRGKRVRTSAEYWRKPLQWNKWQWWECRNPMCDFRSHYSVDMAGVQCRTCGEYLERTRQRVFCASLADVFEDNPQVANWRGELFQLIEKTPNLDWLLLTKRPERIFSLGTDAVGEVFDNWMERNPHVWLGTSVESQEHFDRRVNALTSVYARVHWLSVEPMLGPIQLRFQYRPVDWVVVGGESGRECRPMDMTWSWDVMRYCRQYGIAFFMKQLGGHPNKRDKLADFPEDLRVREYPHV